MGREKSSIVIVSVFECALILSLLSSREVINLQWVKKLNFLTVFSSYQKIMQRNGLQVIITTAGDILIPQKGDTPFTQKSQQVELKLIGQLLFIVFCTSLVTEGFFFWRRESRVTPAASMQYISLQILERTVMEKGSYFLRFQGQKKSPGFLNSF